MTIADTSQGLSLDAAADRQSPNGKLKLQIKKIPGEMLNMGGLPKFADRYPPHLPGGMQRRATLARALANQPVLLMMDEPFSALDPQTRDRLGDELLRIRELTKQTILM